MPPKTRKRRSPPRPDSLAAPQPQRPASPLSWDDGESIHEEEDRSATADKQTPQFFNTTFSTYRVSPLHIGSQALTASRLQTLSRRLRDVLIGDIVRGVQVNPGLESDATLGRAGALEHVEWRWVRLTRLLGTGTTAREGRETSVEPETGAEPEAEERSRRRGRTRSGANARTGARPRAQVEEAAGEATQKALCLVLAYEKATFSAILLPDITNPTQSAQEAEISSLPWTSSKTTTTAGTKKADGGATFLHLPLLLLRLPTPLRSVLVDFLSSTLDCRVSPLRLGTQTLVRFWEDWLARNDRNGALHQQQQKDVTLTLGFHLEPARVKGDTREEEGEKRAKETVPQLGLKALEVVIPAEEIVRFLHAGGRIKDRAGHSDGESSAAPGQGQKQTMTGHRTSTTSTNNNNKNKKRKSDDAFPLGDSVESHRRLRRKMAGRRDDEGWGWRNPPESWSNPDSPVVDETGASGGQQRQEQRQPFTEALASYLSAHIALDLFHPGVRVQRISCAGFVVAESGRVRISGPRSRDTAAATAPDADDADADAGVDGDGPVWSMVRELVRKAKGREWSGAAVELAKLGAGSDDP
ncbi:hypothetical protein DL766_003875 [Monosporascus sp. MC13-8B]|uniref:Uncharacterized protein n=1 Tax=Monosporascus cannonballus TaxID=155416 RepID=A0ABY0HDB8_9PEZI|nr:hypothetical protein DL763_010717 [Monosporascus cannonballus]RYO90825.1 hypothetical protein DL762_002502 [Monosporascus cannonballus]RYP32655.1 hypothetical protein DL766_003875 [Monosporascus sp. MC13-8B]